ncbi:MAG: Holliday junction branch migration protein RuvA [Acholeplasmataceae bacterium]|nr:MAG: Holliday junction branch migration protein RuvA [Acholeplasmataceae bacterium]
MYAYIEGVVTVIRPNHIILENNGVGYHILVPNPYAYHLQERLVVHTYHHVREDVNHLYGFKTTESKELFIRLIGVSGIGPKSALSILASDAVDDTIFAIESGNAKYLTKFPGIGLKSAQQIILDLKGRLVETDELLPTQTNDVEAALLALGYSRAEVRKVMKKIDQDQPVETMIKAALQLLLK